MYTLSAWSDFWSFQWVTNTWSNIVDAVNSFFNWFGSVFTDFFLAIANGFDSVISFFQTLADYVGVLFSNIAKSVALMYSSLGVSGILQPITFSILGLSISVVVFMGVIKFLLGR